MEIEFAIYDLSPSNTHASLSPSLGVDGDGGGGSRRGLFFSSDLALEYLIPLSRKGMDNAIISILGLPDPLTERPCPTPTIEYIPV